MPYQLCVEHYCYLNINHLFRSTLVYFPFLIFPLALPGALADATIALYTDEHLSITNYSQF